MIDCLISACTESSNFRESAIYCQSNVWQDIEIIISRNVTIVDPLTFILILTDTFASYFSRTLTSFRLPDSAAMCRQVLPSGLAKLTASGSLDNDNRYSTASARKMIHPQIVKTCAELLANAICIIVVVIVSPISRTNQRSLRRLGFLPNNTPSFEEMCGSADDVLFGSMLTNEYHVLAQLLPPVKETPYHLRPRAHNRSLPATDNIMRKNFVMRMLYKDSF